VQDVPTTAEQCGIRCRRALDRLPERVRVRLVPDHDVTDLAVPQQDVPDEAAVVLPAGAVVRRVGGTPVDAEHDPDAVRVGRDDTAKGVVVAPGQVPLAGPPDERHAHRSEPECAHRAEDRRRPLRPLDRVVVDADQ
jgi:hypothetical protein